MGRETPTGLTPGAGARLRQLRKELRKTGAEMAAAVEVTRGYWSELENGKRVPGPKLLSALTRVFEIDAQWVLTGRAPQRVGKPVDGNTAPTHPLGYAKTHPVRPSTRRLGEAPSFPGVMEGAPSVQYPGASTMVRFGGVLALPAMFEVVEQVERDYVVIPSIEVAARAGTASSMKDEQERIAACLAGVMAMDRAWMTQQLGREDGGFATITVTGNSMLPTLHDGDTIIIDTMANTIDDDGIYVLRRGSQLVIKRIKVLMDESAIVSGDNEAYGPGEKLQPASLRELRAVGRMVWPRLR
jgi:DNA-binding XRE family transcriptional regulator